MPTEPPVPHYLLLEFLKADGSPLRLADLGEAFMADLKLPPGNSPRPFQVAVERQVSQAGNFFYAYELKNVPLPDGLSTLVRFAGALIPMGRERLSKTRRNPTRDGSIDVTIAGVPYIAKVCITKGRIPYWLNVVAHVKAGKTKASTTPQRSHRGGQIVVD